MTNKDFTLAEKILAMTYHWQHVFDAKLPKKLHAKVSANMLELRMRLKKAKRFRLDKDFVAETVRLSSASPAVMVSRCPLASLPFPVVWMEFDAGLRYRLQDELKGKPPSPTADKGPGGFLLWRFGDDPSMWTALYGMLTPEGKGTLGLAGYQLVPWIGPIPQDNKKVFQGIGWGYATPDGTPAVSQELFKRGRAIPDPIGFEPALTMGYVEDDKFVYKAMWEGRGDMRFLVSALALINVVPTQYVHHPRAGSYQHRLRNLPYLDESVVTIKAGRKKTIHLVDRALRKAAALAARRGHDVRGHWRHIHESGRLSCLHRFDMLNPTHRWCPRCGWRATWIPEHVRGDASRGLVTQTYEVTT